MPDVGKWIKEGLEARGMTQKLLADQMGMAANAVGRWIKGQVKPKPEQIEKIARILQRDPPETVGIRLVRVEPIGNGEVSFMGYVGRELSLDEHKLKPTEPGPHPVRRKRYPEQHQVFLEVGIPSSELQLEAGDHMICVPWDLYRTRPQPTDRVVCRREANGVVRYTLCVAEFAGGEIVLRPVQDGPRPMDLGEPAFLVVTLLQYRA